MGRKSEFHITIGVGIENYTNIRAVVEHHVRLTKAAMLYADKVTLCSPLAPLLTSISSMSKLTERQQIELLEMVVPSIAKDETQIAAATKFCRLYREYNSSGQRSVQRSQVKAFIQREISPFLDGLREKARDVTHQYGVDQFELLLKTKHVGVRSLGQQLSPVQWMASAIQKSAELDSILSSEQFDAPTLPGNSVEEIDSTMQDFLDELESAIKSQCSYPLFDDFTGNLVRLGMKEGRINASEIQASRAKPVGLAIDLMERLPTFDSASVSEILDIRKALDRPLVNFRSAMIEFSKEIKSAAWDEDFPLEADEFFRAKIEPAVVEMEDSVKSNKWLYEVAQLSPGEYLRTPVGGMLGAGFSTLSQVPELASVCIGVAAGIGLTALNVGTKWVQKKNEIEGNQLFFYYKAGKMLEKNR